MFTQIDWEKDIVATTKKPKKGDYTPMSKALNAWKAVENMFWVKFFLHDDPQKKANCLQLMEYFYAKWLLHHSYFYEKYEGKVNPDEVDKFDTLDRDGLPQGDCTLEELQLIQEGLDHIYDRKKR